MKRKARPPFFFSASSQNEFLKSLRDENVNWARVNTFHAREYLGASLDSPHSLARFLRQHIFDHAPFKSVSYIASAEETPDELCERYAALLEDKRPDVAFLEIGPSGELAFNRAHEADFLDPYTVKAVALDEAYRRQKVDEGSFAKLADVPDQAITLTIPALLRIPYILCSAPGFSRAQAVLKTMYGPISWECPSSILRTKAGAMIFTDRDGGTQLIQ